MHSQHLSALEAKHAHIDRQISNEAQRPLPDPLILASLKKQKLRLKEEIISQ
ncbi:MAG: YdcH family protein [Sphingomonas sp.]|nr:YdcH family protein [Sphingomonas sp.]